MASSISIFLLKKLLVSELMLVTSIVSPSDFPVLQRGMLLDHGTIEELIMARRLAYAGDFEAVPVLQNIEDVYDGRSFKHSLQPKGITIHRVGVNKKYGIILGDDAVSVMAHFTGKDTQYPEVAKAVGKKVPYHFLIGEDGTIYQTLPLLEKGYHAMKWSYSTLGIGLIGDFRYEAPTEKQWAASVYLTATLCTAFLIHPDATLEQGAQSIAGHTERPGASKDEDKECPGKFLSMSRFREEVRLMMMVPAKTELEGARIAYYAPESIK